MTMDMNRVLRVRTALLALAALLAACAQEAPAPAPVAILLATSSPAPTATPRPTTVEVDPTAAPTPTLGPAGDCPATFEALDAVDRAMFGNITAIDDVFLDRRFMIW